MQEDPIIIERVDRIERAEETGVLASAGRAQSAEPAAPVAIVRLNRGVTNAISLDLIERLLGALRELRQDRDVRGLVLTGGNEKFFSIGFDLPAILRFPREEMAAFFSAFNELCLTLYTFRGPTAAAVTGHAVAGGFILASCCDYRFVAQGHKLMGMNEVKLGVPVPYPSACILRELAGYRTAREIMDGGEFVGPEEALRLGLVDRIIPIDEVLPQAIELARRLGSEPQQAFSITKRMRVGPVEERVRPRLRESEREFLDCWFSDITQERLREAAAKFRGK